MTKNTTNVTHLTEVPAQNHTMLTSIASFLCRLISEPGNPQYMAVIYPYVLYSAYSAGVPLRWLVVHFIIGSTGMFICVIIKLCVRSPRPELVPVFPWDTWLKETRDTNIPSAHSFTGIAMGLTVSEYFVMEGFSNWWWVFVTWLFSFPILRYFGHQHTPAGIFTGSVIGLIAYICSQFAIAQNFPINMSGLELFIQSTENRFIKN